MDADGNDIDLNFTEDEFAQAFQKTADLVTSYNSASASASTSGWSSAIGSPPPRASLPPASSASATPVRPARRGRFLHVMHLDDSEDEDESEAAGAEGGGEGEERALLTLRVLTLVFFSPFLLLLILARRRLHGSQRPRDVDQQRLHAPEERTYKPHGGRLNGSLFSSMLFLLFISRLIKSLFPPPSPLPFPSPLPCPSSARHRPP